MVLIRLKALGILRNTSSDELKLEKIEKTISRLLNAINGNVDLCKPAEVKKIPLDFLSWVISNYNEKLIPVTSLEKVLNYVDIKVEDVVDVQQNGREEEESIDDLIGRMD